MLMRTGARSLALVAFVGVTALGACTNSGSDEEGTSQSPAIAGRNGAASEENPVGGSPSATGQTRAEQAGAIGPGSAASTSNVNPLTQNTRTQVDSTPELRPNAGPGSE